MPLQDNPVQTDVDELELLLPTMKQVEDIASIQNGWPVNSPLFWLLSEGLRHTEISDLIKGLGQTLVSAGAPIWRLRFAIWTVHPLLSSLSFAWVRGSDEVSFFQSDHDIWTRDTYLGSPAEWVIHNKKPYRQSLEVDLDKENHHRVLFQLKDQGATDYLGLPIPFRKGELNTVFFATDRAGGFEDEDCEKFKLIAQCLIPILESMVTRQIAQIVMETYVGHRTGNKVLNGQIKRGDGELIKAAIWYSDLRDFTVHSETLPANELLEMLNQYFETVHKAVSANGGEVLRFIGDAMLIVFPEETSGSIKEACISAHKASVESLKALELLNQTREKEHKPQIKFGVGLHYGDVIYGNVGAPNRLDFTVMGPAVNQTARLESMTKQLGKRRLMLRPFANALDHGTRSLGFFTLKGIAQDQEILAVDDNN